MMGAVKSALQVWGHVLLSTQQEQCTSTCNRLDPDKYLLSQEE